MQRLLDRATRTGRVLFGCTNESKYAAHVYLHLGVVTWFSEPGLKCRRLLGSGCERRTSRKAAQKPPPSFSLSHTWLSAAPHRHSVRPSISDVTTGCSSQRNPFAGVAGWNRATWSNRIWASAEPLPPTPFVQCKVGWSAPG